MLYIIGQIHILMYCSCVYVKVKTGKMASKSVFGLDHRVYVCFCKVVCWSQFDHWMFAGACRSPVVMVVLLMVSWEYNCCSNLLWIGLCWLETKPWCSEWLCFNDRRSMATAGPSVELSLIFSCKGQSIGGGLANAASYIVVSLSDVAYTGVWLPFLTSSKSCHYCFYCII